MRTSTTIQIAIVLASVLIFTSQPGAEEIHAGRAPGDVPVAQVPAVSPSNNTFIPAGTFPTSEQFLRGQPIQPAESLQESAQAVPPPPPDIAAVQVFHARLQRALGNEFTVDMNSLSAHSYEGVIRDVKDHAAFPKGELDSLSFEVTSSESGALELNIPSIRAKYFGIQHVDGRTLYEGLSQTTGSNEMGTLVAMSKISMDQADPDGVLHVSHGEESIKIGNDAAGRPKLETEQRVDPEVKAYLDYLNGQLTADYEAAVEKVADDGTLSIAVRLHQNSTGSIAEGSLERVTYRLNVTQGDWGSVLEVNESTIEARHLSIADFDSGLLYEGLKDHFAILAGTNPFVLMTQVEVEGVDPDGVLRFSFQKRSWSLSRASDGRPVVQQLST